MPLLMVIMLLVALMALGVGVASGQRDYPNKPIRMVTSEAGGGSDLVARLLAPGLSARLGQPVVIDSRGGSMVIRADILLKAPSDGYTLFVNGNSFWLLPLLQDVRYDPVRDFSPIVLVSIAPAVLVVHPSLPAKSVQELIALAKAKPGALNYASGLTGAANHLGAELFKAMAGVDIVRVPYKGGGPLLNALIGGQAQLAFSQATSVTPHVKSGRLRALAVTSAEPSALLPGLATVAASGLPGFEAVVMTGMFATTKTPTAIINRLNQESVRVLSQADIKEKFLNVGVEIVGSSPEQFGARMKSDVATMGKVIKDAGIRAE